METIGWYLNQIGKVPLLTHEQELLLGKQVQAARALKEELSSSGASPTVTQRQILLAGKRSLERMIKANLRLVVNIARKYHSNLSYSSMDLLDLIQEGNIGLRRAVELYDPSRGYKFSTYSYWWIRQSISRSLNYGMRPIRVPVEPMRKLRRFIHSYHHEHGLMPSFELCASELNTTVATIEHYLNHFNPVASLDSPAGESFDHDRSNMVELIPGDNNNTVEELHDEDLYDRVCRAMADFDDREKFIITRRFGLDGKEPEPQGVIARKLEIGRQRISDLEKKLICRLRMKCIEVGLSHSVVF